MGVRVLDEARAWRLRKKLKPKKGEFKELNPRTFKDLAHQFNWAPITVNRNYNEAIKYHKLRILKKAKKTGQSAEQEEEEAIDMSGTSDELSEEEDVPGEEEAVSDSGKKVPELLLVPKQEPNKQASLLASEQ